MKKHMVNELMQEIRENVLNQCREDAWSWKIIEQIYSQ